MTSRRSCLPPILGHHEGPSPLKQQGKRSCPTSPEKPHSSPAPPAASAAPARWHSPPPVRKSWCITAVAPMKPTVSSARYAKLAAAVTQSRPIWRELMGRTSLRNSRAISSAIASISLSLMLGSRNPPPSKIPPLRISIRLFAVNVRAPFFLVQQLLPILSKGSSIVLVASLAARGVVGTIPAYAATKGAIDTLVKHFASLLGARGIRVNAVAPGVVETDMSNFTKTDAGRDLALGMQALKRLAQPDDIGGVVAFLASEDARWITGDTIHVDGGSKL